MSIQTLAAYEPVSSGEIRAIDFDRVEEVERKHELLRDYLHLKGLNGLFLQDPANFSWLTCGGDNTYRGTSGPRATIFLNGEARVLLCDSVDSGYLFDQELPGLGFQLKERPWHEPRERLMEDMCRGRRTGSDTPGCGGEYVGADLVDFRVRLTSSDHDLLRRLGRLVSHAVEATARNLKRGATEAEVAGEMAHRLLKHEVQPVRLQAMADGQGRRYRRWTYGSDVVERFCVLSATGRLRGLHVTATRTVCFDEPPKPLRQAYAVCALVQATGMLFSQPGWSIADVWQRVERIYEKFSAGEEWHQAEQGEVTGYRSQELPITPSAGYLLEEGMAVTWRPSARSAAVGDTILLSRSGNELLTPMEQWPRLAVEIRGTTLDCPDLLIR